MAERDSKTAPVKARDVKSIVNGPIRLRYSGAPQKKILKPEQTQGLHPVSSSSISAAGMRAFPWSGRCSRLPRP